MGELITEINGVKFYQGCLIAHDILKPNTTPQYVVYTDDMDFRVDWKKDLKKECKRFYDLQYGEVKRQEKLTKVWGES